MSEWIIILLLANLIGLIFIKRHLNRIEESDKNQAYSIDYLGSEIRNIARQLKQDHGKAGEQPAKSAEKPAMITPPAKQPAGTAVKPAPVAPPPLPASQPRAPGSEAEVSKPHQPQSRLAENAQEILGRIWRWIVYGDENRREGISSEVAIATTWLIRAGVIVVVMGAIYFLKWSLERDLISPAVRVGISMITGIGLLVTGINLLGRQYHLMGQGLLGGGLLILYASSFSAGPVYHMAAPRS